MAWTALTHTAAGSGDTNSVTTSAIDTTGASLIVMLSAQYNTGTATPSDSKSNAWDTYVLRGSTPDIAIQLHTTAGNVGTGHTFTISGTTLYPSVCVLALSGGSQWTTQQTGSATSSTGVTTVQAGSLTPNEDNCIVIAGFGQRTNNPATPSIDGGFTITDSLADGSPVYVGIGLAYLIQTTATAANPTWTVGIAGNLAASLTAFAADAVTGHPWHAYAQQ